MEGIHTLCLYVRVFSWHRFLHKQMKHMPIVIGLSGATIPFIILYICVNDAA